MQSILVSPAYTQRGMTVYGMIFMLIVVGFIATAAVKIGPAYVDNNTVAKALKDIQDGYANADIQEITDSEIRGKVDKYFQVNMVDDAVEKNMKITRVRDKVLLSINYEVRKNFMGNLDVVMVFTNEVNLGH